MVVTWDTAATAITFSNGNLTAKKPSGSGTSQFQCTTSLPSGLFTYAEFTLASLTSTSVDIGIGHNITNFSDFVELAIVVANGTSWQAFDGPTMFASGTFGHAPTVIQVAYDQPNDKLYIGADGTWVVGDPNALTGGHTPSAGAGTYFFQADFEGGASAPSITANFGGAGFAETPPTGTTFLDTPTGNLVAWTTSAFVDFGGNSHGPMHFTVETAPSWASIANGGNFADDTARDTARAVVDQALADFGAYIDAPQANLIINIGWGDVDGLPIGPGGIAGSSVPGFTSSFATVRSDMMLMRSDPIKAISRPFIPSSDPFGSPASWEGFWGVLMMQTNLHFATEAGYCGFDDTADWNFTLDRTGASGTGTFHFYHVVLHEFSQAIGRFIDNGNGNYGALSLFAYSGVGTLTTVYQVGGIYWSIDGGTTNLGDMADSGSDAAEFNASTNSPFSNPYSGPGGMRPQDVTLLGAFLPMTDAALTFAGFGAGAGATDGDASGAASVVGVARGKHKVAGAAAGVALALGVARAKFRTVGLAAGSASVGGETFRDGNTAGSSSGAATVAGIGKAKSHGAGASHGAATAAGVGKSKASNHGSTAGSASVSGVGKSKARMVGLAAGTTDIRGWSPQTGTGKGLKHDLMIGMEMAQKGDELP